MPSEWFLCQCGKIHGVIAMKLCQQPAVPIKVLTCTTCNGKGMFLEEWDRERHRSVVRCDTCSPWGVNGIVPAINGKTRGE